MLFATWIYLPLRPVKNVCQMELIIIGHNWLVQLLISHTAPENLFKYIHSY